MLYCPLGVGTLEKIGYTLLRGTAKSNSTHFDGRQVVCLSRRPRAMGLAHVICQTRVDPTDVHAQTLGRREMSIADATDVRAFAVRRPRTPRALLEMPEDRDLGSKARFAPLARPPDLGTCVRFLIMSFYTANRSKPTGRAERACVSRIDERRRTMFPGRDRIKMKKMVIIRPPATRGTVTRCSIGAKDSPGSFFNVIV